MIDLTDRQRQIAELLLAGCERRSVCERLGFARHTLRAHISDMRHRLGAADDAAMMRALREMTRDPLPVMLERCRERPRKWWMV